MCTQKIYIEFKQRTSFPNSKCGVLAWLSRRARSNDPSIAVMSNTRAKLARNCLVSWQGNAWTMKYMYIDSLYTNKNRSHYMRLPRDSPGVRQFHQHGACPTARNTMHTKTWCMFDLQQWLYIYIYLNKYIYIYIFHMLCMCVCASKCQTASSAAISAWSASVWEQWHGKGMWMCR